MAPRGGQTVPRGGQAVPRGGQAVSSVQQVVARRIMLGQCTGMHTLQGEIKAIHFYVRCLCAACAPSPHVACMLQYLIQQPITLLDNIFRTHARYPPLHRSVEI